jgi:hypothetical protein
MAEIASAYVALLPSAKGMGEGITHELGGAGAKGGKSAAKGFKGSFIPGVKAIGGMVAGAFAVSKGVDFLKDSVGEAREAQKVGAQTAQTIKTTGGAAKVSAKHVGDLATAISTKAGIDDEAIQTGANLLLTFKDIKNEAGKGNDIFDQTTKTMVDMSAAMGKDPKASAIALGKALNDPVKGMTALSKVGVTFTEQQKATNKALVQGGPANALMAMGVIGSTQEWNLAVKANNNDIGKTVDILTKKLTPAQKKHFEYLDEGGHKMAAQKVILKELNSEFGGSAAATATAGEKAKVAFGNLKEQVGTALLPVIDKVATFLTDKAVPAISDFITGIQDGTGPGGQLADVVGRIKDALTDALPYVQNVIGFLVDNKEAVGAFAAVILTVAAAVKAWSIVQAVLNVALTANPLGLVVIALAALAFGLVYAWKHSEKFRDIVMGALHAVGAVGRWLWNNVFSNVFKFILGGIALIIDGFGKMLRGPGARAGLWVGKESRQRHGYAADKARDMADHIKKIPDHKEVKVKVKFDPQ